ncbi:hypothetical protein, partial [Treponema sp. R80B11-R83G3]
MFNKKMATVIVGIALALGAVLLFPACNKNKSAAASAETVGTAASAETSGTASPFETPDSPNEMPSETPFQTQFAGTYVNANGDKKQIEANGAVDGCRLVGFFIDTISGIYELRYWIGQDVSIIHIV